MLKLPDSTRKRSVLGQGLDALLPLKEAPSSKSEKDILDVPIDALVPNPHQPRRVFSESSLAELSASLKEMGVLQPLIVRPLDGAMYEIVAGERRWRAAKLAGFASTPVIVRPVSDSEAMEIALIENIQREDLNPLDTAEAYDNLIRRFSYTHEDLARRVGKDRTSITNHLRLLKLPDLVKEDLREERLSMGHARTLLGVDHEPTQLRLRKRVVDRKLSVRELEKIVQNYKDKPKTPRARSQSGADHSDIERRLTEALSAPVKVKLRESAQGRIEIAFGSLEELERLVSALSDHPDRA